MKILHIISTLEIGGAEKLMVEILPLLNKSENITLLINKCAHNAFYQKLQMSGVRIVSLNYPRLNSPLNVLLFAREMRNYDIIHAHLFPTLYWVAIANIILRKPLLYTEHSTYNRRRKKWYLKPIERWVYNRYKKIISISDLTEINLKKWICAGNGDQRFVVIQNGININEYKRKCVEHIYPHTLIMISRFAPEKDQATIIRAMSLLPDDYHLILVGGGNTMSLCRKLAKDIGVSGRVHFVGVQTNISNWVSLSDIGIQSSNWEGFGLTAVEMMAGGLPVIATDVDGLKQVVDGAGLLFPVGDHKRLAEIVEKLTLNKEYYNSVKNNCFLRAKKFDIRRTSEAYLMLYRDIFNESCVE